MLIATAALTGFVACQSTSTDASQLFAFEIESIEAESLCKSAQEREQDVHGDECLFAAGVPIHGSQLTIFVIDVNQLPKLPAACRVALSRGPPMV